jgi:membrane protein
MTVTAPLYEEKGKRGFIKLILISLAFTIAAIALLLVALGAVVVAPVVLSYLGLQSTTELLFRFARWPILLLSVIFALAVLYRYGRSRREPRWQWISVGSAFAAIAWLISSASFADYNATYGSTRCRYRHDDVDVNFCNSDTFRGSVESEIEHQTARDSTVEDDKPLGARGAVMADIVGEAR